MDSYTNNRLIISSPSNIALIKYWGKIQGKQIPMNPSLSFTLSKCRTNSTVEILPKANRLLTEFSLSGNKNEKFQIKAESYLMRVCKLFQVKPENSLALHTENTFPHSSGIASSASAFASLSFMAFYLIKKRMPLLDQCEDQKFISSLAREGSGSACRSLFGGINLWGEYNTDGFLGCNDFSVKLEQDQFHEVFKEWRNNIIIVSSEIKEQSSTAGHGLMNNHFYREGRIQQAKKNLQNCLSALQQGQLDDFGLIIENEALSLHGLMMSSYPSFTLLKPNSIHIIHELRKFREQNSCHLYFTIDAGPNIHVLFPASEQHYFDQFKQLISGSFEKIIEDEISLMGSTCEDISKEAN